MKRNLFYKGLGVIVMASALLVTPLLSPMGGNAERNVSEASMLSVSAATKTTKKVTKLVAPKNLKEGVIKLAPASMKGKLYTEKKDKLKLRVYAFTKIDGKNHALVSPYSPYFKEKIENVSLEAIPVSNLILSSTKDAVKNYKKSPKLVAPKKLKEGVMTPASASFKGKFYTAKKGTTVKGIGSSFLTNTSVKLEKYEYILPTQLQVHGFTKKAGKEYAIVSTVVPDMPSYNVSGAVEVSKLSLSALQNTDKAFKKGSKLATPKGMKNYKKINSNLYNVQLQEPSYKEKLTTYHVKKKQKVRKLVKSKNDEKLVKATLSAPKNQILKVLYFYKVNGVGYALVASVNDINKTAVYEVPVKQLVAN